MIKFDIFIKDKDNSYFTTEAAKTTNNRLIYTNHSQKNYLKTANNNHNRLRKYVKLIIYKSIYQE